MKNSWSLSRGRTLLQRGPQNVGHVVHEAGSMPDFVHLSVIRSASLDNENPDLVDVMPTHIRVTVGEDSQALCFSLNENDIKNETRLVDNLLVNSWETVVVSTSNPNANLVIHGVCTSKPILR